MSLSIAVHVIVSLAGLASGFVVLYGLLTARQLNGWNALFLLTTAATSLTGLVLPSRGLMPSHVIAILSLLVVGLAALARYRFSLKGPWRKTYLLSAVISLYFNCFVLVAQLFAKVADLRALAPTQSEPPFAFAQLIVLTAFVALGYRGLMGFSKRPA